MPRFFICHLIIYCIPLNYSNIEKMVDQCRHNDKRALSRLISLVENDQDKRTAVTEIIHQYLHGTFRVGLTGPPGAGKSTILSGLVKILLEKEMRVGVVAVDPTSPFTGGALLGDRVRMTAISTDPRVYIRSLASRGALGGLASATEDVIDLMDCFGCDIVMIETIGVGQAELDIVGSADTIMVVLVPESGDSIQAMKAGMMEIGDIFVLNKSDRQGAEQAALEIETAIRFRAPDDWVPPIINTTANRGEGLDNLFAGIENHRSFMIKYGRLEEKKFKRRWMKIRRIVEAKLEQNFWSEERLSLLNKLADGNTPIFTAAEMLLKN